jgi:hypothetical protein
MEVKPDPRRGHIVLVDGDRGTVVAFTDLGPVLRLWQYDGGVELDPDAARCLSEALTEWADRKAARHQESA